MWIKAFYISVILSLFMMSCKKESTPWERDSEFEIDTASFLFEAKYISHIDSQIIFQVDVATLNGLQSEQNYFNAIFYDSVRPYLNASYTVNSVSTQQKTPTAYTTVLLFDQNGTYWHNENYMGVYLRRYFETVENSNVSKLALAKFFPQNNESISFYKESSNSYINNSWEFNTNKFYELSNENYNDNYITTNVFYMIDRLNEALDSLISFSDKTGDLSITFFSQGGYESFQSEAIEVDNLITKANANNIKINLIGFESSTESAFRRIAQETGGFICSKEINYQTVQYIYSDDKKITPIGSFIGNLDLILQHKITTHTCTIQVDRTDGGIYLSGQKMAFQINYDHKMFTIQFTLP